MLQENIPLPDDFLQFSKGSPPCRQKFSFPHYMMSHITSNITKHEVYQKLIQTCKYFYSKNSIVVIERIGINLKKTWIESQYEGHILATKSLPEFPSKFWITTGLKIYGIDAINFEILNSKIYRFTLVNLDIDNVKIKYSDLVLVASKGTFIKVSLLRCDIIHAYSIDISDIVKLFVGAKELYLFVCNSTPFFTSETVQKLMNIPAFPNLDKLVLYNVPETLNLDEFITFTNKHSKFWTKLWFSRNISQSYRNSIINLKQKLYNAKILVNV